jgi:hypothetical protein
MTIWTFNINFIVCELYNTEWTFRAIYGNRVGIGLSDRPARLDRLADRFLGIDSWAPFKKTASVHYSISVSSFISLPSENVFSSCYENSNTKLPKQLVSQDFFVQNCSYIIYLPHTFVACFLLRYSVLRI